MRLVHHVFQDRTTAPIIEHMSNVPEFNHVAQELCLKVSKLGRLVMCCPEKKHLNRTRPILESFLYIQVVFLKDSTRISPQSTISLVQLRYKASHCTSLTEVTEMLQLDKKMKF